MSYLSIVRRAPSEQRTANDADAYFATVYEQYSNRIYRYISAKVGSHQEAEDLTAKTFVKALVGIRKGRNGDNIVGWLFGIARHVVADHYRKRKSTMVALKAAESIAQPTRTLSDIAQQNIRLTRVAEALSSLSPDRAEALSLRIFGGLSSQEVAEVMNKTPEAVKMLIYRATQDLQKRLGNIEEL